MYKAQFKHHHLHEIPFAHRCALAMKLSVEYETDLTYNGKTYHITPADVRRWRRAAAEVENRTTTATSTEGETARNNG